MESLALFVLASIALIITPGPDLIYVLTRGMNDGKLSGIISAIGVTSGILVHTLAAAFGLAILLKTSTVVFYIIKTAGGLYLIFLGYQMLKNNNAFELNTQAETAGLKKIFIQGALSNILNPKVALFFVAFLPQFVSSDISNERFEMVALGLLFASMTVLFLMCLGFFAGSVGDFLKKKRGIQGKIRTGSGTLLILLGFRLVLPLKN